MSRLPKRRSRINAKVEGAGRQAKAAREIANMLNLERSARDVAKDAELIYAANAPHRSGRLSRGIRAVATGGGDVAVTATAVDPDTGFDYVRVSRFGHRKALIFPVTKRGQRRQSRTKVRDPKTGRFTSRGRSALVFNSRGKTWKLPYVKGFRPKGDWVARSQPEITAAAETEMEATGNKIAARWAS